MKETFFEQGDKLITKTTYDNSDVIALNKADRNSSPEFGRYKTANAGLVHVGRIAEGDVVRLHNMGYKLLSADKEEVKRALLYIQNNEPFLLTVPGKPFSKKKLIWS